MVIILLSATYIVFATNFLNRYRKSMVNRNKRTKDELFKIVVNGLESGNIDSLDDLYNIYKGFYRYDLENDSYREHINKLLREFLVTLLQQPEDEDLENQRQIKQKIDGFNKMKNYHLSQYYLFRTESY